MEILLYIVSFILMLIILGELNKKFKSINWLKFIFFIIVGGGFLAVLFSYTAETALVMSAAFVALIILGLLFGFFSENPKKKTELGPREIAQNLLDILDDETISNKTELPLREVKELRSINKEI